MKEIIQELNYFFVVLFLYENFSNAIMIANTN